MTPDIAVVLGSGLGAAADALGPVRASGAVWTSDVPGHDGTIEYRSDVLLLRGRQHLYEGHSPEQACANVRAAHELGYRTLILTNMVGAVDPTLPSGVPVLISDHVNLTGRNPLSGPQFVDLTNAYSPRLRELAREVEPSLREAVYAQFTGPSYETPAEVAMLRTLGVGLVGMSTAIECIQARALGMDVLALSVPADVAGDEVTHEGVLEVAERAAPALGRIIAEVCALLQEEREAA